MRIFTHKRVVLFIFILFLFLLFCCRHIITGYWKLNTLCELDAGSRIYEPLERNVGWIMSDFYEGESKNINFLPIEYNPAFIRYIKYNGEEFDVINITSTGEYATIPADKSKSIRYIYSYSGEHLKGDKRFWKKSVIIIDVNKRIVVASHTNYSFVWTLSRWLWNYQVPTGSYCSNVPRRVYHGDFPNEIYGNNITPRRIFR